MHKGPGYLTLTRETCPTDILHTMVGYEELLLPPHEDSTAVHVRHRQVRFLQLVSDMSERREAGPMNHVFLLGCAPVTGQETIPTPYDLSIEVGGEFRPVVC